MGIRRFVSEKFGTSSYDAEKGYRVRELKGLELHGSNALFFSIPAADIPALAAKYFSAMETEESKNWCRCQWIVHPDDINVKAGTCRECGDTPDSDYHNIADPDYTHDYRGKRMRKGEQVTDCPVHTKEGMLIYFFEWIFNQ